MARLFRTISMQDIEPSSAYDLLTAAIVPRPIAFITTINASGEPNVAPFSFLTVGGAHPPSLAFSAVIGPDGQLKDTFLNVQANGEFVVCTAHRDMVGGMIASSTNERTEETKWDRAGFTALPSLVVKPPRLAESLIQMECTVFRIIEHGEGPGSARYVIGEVQVTHLAEELFRDEAIAPDLMYSVARLGGRRYLDTASLELFS